jgi:hypothetical protein
MDIVPRQHLLVVIRVEDGIDNAIYGHTATGLVLELEEEMTKDAVADFMLLHIQHVCPRLISGVLGENSPKEVRIHPHLDESLAGEPSHGCRRNGMVAMHPDFLKLLDDMTIELLVPGKMDDALDEFLHDLLRVILG